jgi:hypothetical protein
MSLERDAEIARKRRASYEKQVEMEKVDPSSVKCVKQFSTSGAI